MVTEPKGSSTVASGHPGTDQDIAVVFDMPVRACTPFTQSLGVLDRLHDNSNENTSCGQLAFIVVVGPHVNALIDTSNDDTK